ncbi:FAD-dependent pyridine nucleotide-disulfide oxidoreductase [Candidatus Terasakiella magnetica]|uniref:FAD-dependent pyridine nucleotide-disulfide oxidoreductase n=1 Tax=Candidatus Terasakiella magnetica TaxID=1867952 RepID=A0A1C3RL44_9PROT|nr:FAD/NAD(P)-binding oxidoreductase [Candidatus Terasakiella magnetica]SCA57978.1 FAD-dependent pyridine nucleotide-disulfide oxidoreductase [Candidatus Terasakiella magnetica]
MFGLLKKVFAPSENVERSALGNVQNGNYDYVVVGAGPAGVQTVENLRAEDPTGTILLISGEAEPPYSRMAIPYYLIGKVEEDGTYLRKSDTHYDDLNIDYRQGLVKKVDSVASSLKLADGSSIHYGKLCLATGASPIKPPIPGLDNKGVHHCWTLEDARKIIELAHEGAHVVLMGAGFIGCIILEALALRKVNLTVVEMGDRMVPRMLNPTCGNLVKDWCNSHGVSVHTSTKITMVEPNKNDPEDTLLVDLDNGEQIPAHLLVVAAGVRSNVAFLEGSGVEVEEGIKVDAHLQTAVSNIYAAGDVAQGPDFSTGGWSVHAIQPTAADHGRIAAKNMCGHETPYQGSLVMNVLDTLGLISASFGLWEGVPGGDSVERLDAENYRYIRLEFDGDVLIGAQTLGRTDHVGVLRGLIQSRTELGPWKERLMADPHRIMDAYVALSQM